jgi:hypothetical protein
MKKLLTLLLVVAVAMASHAQGGKRKGGAKSANLKQVEASEVPEAVKNSFKTSVTDVRWEKHEAMGKGGKSHVRYVAIYTQDGVRSRSRFKEDGTALSSSKYMGAKKLPASIQSAATSKYPNIKLVGGEEFTTKTGQVYYRVRLRDKSTKITTLFDANGGEVTKEKMTDDLKEGEDEGGEN